MSERRENSVLFSLKELRRIEDDRVKREEDDAKARIEADRAAKETAARQMREAEEQKHRDEEDRVRRIEAEKTAKAREEQLRLQESEQRHRVEGELRLQEERMRLEVQSRKGSSPIKAVAGVAAVLIVIASGLGYRMYSQHQAEMAAGAAERARIESQAKAERMELENKMIAIQKDMNDRLASAHSEEERARIRDQAAAARAEVAQQQAGEKRPHKHGDKGDTTAAAAPVYKKVVKKNVSDNPLEGLGL